MRSTQISNRTIKYSQWQNQCTVKWQARKLLTGQLNICKIMHLKYKANIMHAKYKTKSMQAKFVKLCTLTKYSNRINAIPLNFLLPCQIYCCKCLMYTQLTYKRLACHFTSGVLETKWKQCLYCAENEPNIVPWTKSIILTSRNPFMNGLII